MNLNADKTFLKGSEYVLNIFIGEMMSLGFNHEQIIEAVIERCDIDSLEAYEETKRQLNHLNDNKRSGRDDTKKI